MTPKQRVRTAMLGGIPDCVPFIPQICHPHAIKILGRPYEETCLNIVRDPQLMNKISFEVVKLYGVDGLRAWMPSKPKEVFEQNGLWYGRDPETGKTLGRVDFEGGGGIVAPEEATIHTEEDIEAIPIPSVEELVASGRLDSVKAVVDEAGDDYFVVSAAGAFTVQHLALTRGKLQAMVDLVDRPDFCHHSQEKALEIALQHARALCAIGVDALMIGDTFSGVVGPEWFRRHNLPYFRRFVDTIKAEYGEERPVIYLHVCGNGTPLLELMADTGVDCIEPLDHVAGVEVCEAKRRVGDRVALMGGANTVKLAHGTLAEVREDIGRCLREGAPGGGYILAAGDMLPTETSREKVELMLEMARAYTY